MVTGAANAEAALLLIDAHEGVQENSRRHGYLLNLLGIRQIAVLVNKMDLENYSEASFNADRSRISRSGSSTIGVEPKSFHPDRRQARRQHRLAEQEHALVERPDRAAKRSTSSKSPSCRAISRCASRSRMSIASTSGASWPAASKPARIKVGDRLVFSPTQQDQHGQDHRALERAVATDSAGAGESIGITLTEQIFVERGAIAALETAPPYELTRFKARVFWLGKQPFTQGQEIQAQARHAGSRVRNRIDRKSDRCLHARNRFPAATTKSSSAATKWPN